MKATLLRPHPYVDLLALMVGPLAIFLWPLANGEILLAGTDSLFTHFPNILIAAEALKATGSLPLWNPYILGGLDFSSTMHNHIANPLLQWIGYLPQSVVLPTFSVVLMGLWIWIGLAVTSALRLLSWNRTSALVLGLVFQLGGLGWFGLSNLSSYFGLVGLSTSFFGLVTFQHRCFPAGGRLAGVGLYSVGLIFILNCGQPGHIEAYLVPVLIMTAWVCAFRQRTGVTSREVAILALATVGSILTQLPRLGAIAGDLLANAQELTSTWRAVGSASYYLLQTAFSPAVLGLDLGESLRITALVGGEGAQHIQFHAPPYLGAAFLVFSAYLLVQTGTRAQRVLWLAGFCLVLAQVVTIQPLTNLLHIILFPMHEIVPKTFGYLLMFVAIALSLKSGLSLTPNRRTYLVAAAAYTLVAVSIVTLEFRAWETRLLVGEDRSTDLLVATRIPLLGLAAAVITLVVIGRHFARSKRPLDVTLTTALFLILLTLAAVTGALYVADYLDDVTAVAALLLLTGALASIVIVWSALNCGGARPRKSGRLTTFFMVLVLGAWCTIVCIPAPAFNVRSAIAIAWTQWIGLIFAVVCTTGLLIGLRFVEGRTRHVLVVALVLLNLVSAQKVLTYSGGNGFVAQASMFPRMSPEWSARTPAGDQVDGQAKIAQADFWRLANLGQYRVGNPEFLGAPHGFNSVSATQGLRTIGGAESYVSDDLILALQVAGEEKTLARHGVESVQQSPRLLDLFGVRYVAAADGSVRVRPTALPRVGFFTACLVQTDRQSALQQLLKGAIDPDYVLVVEEGECRADVVLSRVVALPYTSDQSNRVEIELQGVTDGWVFLGDVFNPGWKASVDGQARDVVRADGVFMAVPVRRGEVQLRMEYANDLSVRFSWAPLVGHLALGIALALQVVHRRQSRLAIRRNDMSPDA